ncbi:FADR140Cp [Eremothecium gossypii FDAG1]|nr:FADR140Cp [Eremothecium gossypii FDAG1]
MQGAKSKSYRKLPAVQQRAGPKVVEFRDDEEDQFDGMARRLNASQLRQRAAELLKVRETLPVYRHQQSIMEHLNSNPVTILIGETGSGKSTQLPQLLLAQLKEEDKKGAIAVTQPRRVAAVSLATRVAQEHGCNLGDEVGYSVRFDSCAHPSRTRLKYLTDGMLLRELIQDKNLRKYRYVVIDEAHERTILTDLILGFLKQLLRTTRPDLRVLVMSATLQGDKFSAFFDGAPVLFVEGRKFPVEIRYLSQPCEDVVDAVVRCCVQINSGEQLGDLLCFMPGQEEIDKAVGVLAKISEHLDPGVPRITALPLYAALPPAEQAKVFLPLKGFRRKIILSTNIAETSVTIAGVKYVVDTGLRKCKVWRHQLGLATLLTVPISKASASQRAGRAGRESAGKCFRLYREADYEQLPGQSEPEIVRCDATAPLLMLKQIGVDDLLNWTWLEHPGRDSIVQGLQELYQLGALDDSGAITDDGRKMALLPLAPHLSRVLLEARRNHCLPAVLDIVACLSVDNLLLSPPPEARDEVNARRAAACPRGARYGDLLMLKELYDHYAALPAPDRADWCRRLCASARGFRAAAKTRAQLHRYAAALLHWHPEPAAPAADLHAPQIAAVVKSFLAGFARNTAIRMPDRSYRTTSHGEPISIHPSSLLFFSAYAAADRPSAPAPAILYVEYVFTSKGYARGVTRVELDWLQELQPRALGKRSAR